jgi:hypothetical protein
MRTYQHIIDTKAVKLTLNAMPDHWVVRDLSERDYGIDLMVEIFSEQGKDEFGHSFYDATGRVCYLQVKGTNSKFSLNTDQSVSFNIDKKSLLYVEKFATPFILVRVCTLDNEKTVYYCWLQRFILEVLDKKKPDWREKTQEKFAVRIPSTNSLPSNPLKIEKIAGRIKYIEEASEFYEKYTMMKPGFESMIKGKFTPSLFDSFINDLKRIKNLTTLLELNNCQINQADISILIQFIDDIKNGKQKPKSIKDFPDPIMFNLDLLESDNFMRMALEELIAENEGDTVY